MRRIVGAHSDELWMERLRNAGEVRLQGFVA